MRNESNDKKGGEVTETKTVAPNPIATLYYSAKSCGAGSFLAAHIANLRLATVAVDINVHKTQNGIDFKTINRKGNVPTLVLPDGTLLNEGVACLLWIVDQNQSANLAPPNGTLARYGVINTLAWVASELQPCITRLIPANDAAVKKPLIEKALEQLTHFERLITGRNYLDGSELGVSDLIAHIILGWAPTPKVGLTLTDPLNQYLARVRTHPLVVAARTHMSLSPPFTSP